jgi:hypothetical protein
METVVCVPLLFWLLLEISRDDPTTPRRAAKIGFISSLAVLARLDIGLLVGLAVVGWAALARPRAASAWRVFFAFCAGGAALALYAAINLMFFGALLTTSAAAKQLVRRPGINLGYLKYVATGTPFGPSAGLIIALGGLAALWLWSGRGSREQSLRPRALFAASLALVFAAGFYALNTWSGWVFFGWYAYPLPVALVAALVLVGVAAVPRIAARLRARASAAVLAIASAAALIQGVYAFVTRGPLWSVEDNGLLAMSKELATRLQDREGVFGMGAIAGFAVYELHKPMVQLEGLVADRAMVEHIRHEDDLGPVLREYHVDYLVVSLHSARLEKRGGCYEVTQPNAEWSGNRVARMSGAICAEPIVHFLTRLPARPWSIFSSLDTYVFDLRGAEWSASAAPL